MTIYLINLLFFSFVSPFFVIFTPLQLEGKTVLKFALCYGFQNLQNIVRKLKTRKCDYQYVEIMACPAGSSSLLCKTVHGKKSLCCVINDSSKCRLPEWWWAD